MQRGGPQIEHGRRRDIAQAVVGSLDPVIDRLDKVAKSIKEKKSERRQAWEFAFVSSFGALIAIAAVVSWGARMIDVVVLDAEKSRLWRRCQELYSRWNTVVVSDARFQEFERLFCDAHATQSPKEFDDEWRERVFKSDSAIVNASLNLDQAILRRLNPSNEYDVKWPEDLASVDLQEARRLRELRRFSARTEPHPASNYPPSKAPETPAGKAAKVVRRGAI